MALSLDTDTLLQVVAPKLLRMTAASLGVAGAVGAGALALTSLRRRRLRRAGPPAQAGAPREHRPLWPVLWGTWFGVFLIGLLPIEAHPASLIGGPFAGLWGLAMALVLVPAGAVTGIGLGLLLARGPHPCPRRPRLAGGLTLAAYLVAAMALHLGLAAPAITIRTPAAAVPVPLLAAISGYGPLPSALALSGDGQQLAVLTVRHGRQQLDLLDLSRRTRQRLPLADQPPPEQRTLKDSLSSLAFSRDGQELITAAVQQVQVRSLASGRPRLRLEGGGAAYPMADQRLVTLAAVEARAASPQPHSLRLWDLSSGALLQTLAVDLPPTERTSLPIAVAPDGRRLACPRTPFDDRLQVWGLAGTRPLRTLRLSAPAGILSLAWSPDGRQLALALGQGPSLTIWDLETAAPIRSLETEQRVRQLHWTDRGLLADLGGVFRVLDPMDGTVLHTLQLDAAAPSPGAPSPLAVVPAALSADGTTLAAYLPRQGIGVWRVGGGAPPASGSSGRPRRASAPRRASSSSG